MRRQLNLIADGPTPSAMLTRHRRRRRFGAGFVMIAVAAAALSGCAVAREQNRGDQVEADRLDRIVPGTHGKSDVAAILGSPSSVAPFDGDAWYYISSRTETIAFLPTEVTERQVVVVRFNDQGTVSEVETFGMERGEDVAFSDRVTPTFGTDLNAMEQLVSNLGRFNRDDEEAPRK
jgi:outer membrane protein assembly factor BamE (lipoprotein component of BamABCDE complex)